MVLPTRSSQPFTADATTLNWGQIRHAPFLVNHTYTTFLRLRARAKLSLCTLVFKKLYLGPPHDEGIRLIRS